MEYITLQNLCTDIRENLSKIPKEVLGIVGIPRSGMLPATIISEYLNLGLCSINELIESENINDLFNKHGNRKLRETKSNKILVVDDTCYAGSEISRNREKIFSKFNNSGYEFIFLVVYMEGEGSIAKPDIYLRDVRSLAQKSEIGIVLYEWNILAHGRFTESCLFDLDGVMCIEPPDERNINDYVEYIKSPTPLFIPTSNKITIVTYRLEKYRKETEDFLKSIGISNFLLNMFPSGSYEERSKIPPYIYKSNFYKENDCYKLFIESSDFQAKKIHELTNKPVYCTDTNKMYS